MAAALSMPLLLLLGVLVVAAAVSAWAITGTRSHAAAVRRARERDAGSPLRGPVLRAEPSATTRRVERAVSSLVPEGVLDPHSAARLARAGFDLPIAPTLYVLVRVLVAAALPVVTFLLLRDQAPPLLLVGGLAVSALLGLLLPPALLRRLERRRQQRIRHAIPDCLDLLLVCVEAGISLDAALLRVGREMQVVHPELARELLVINRKSNAGMRREEALHGLFDRTGVDELRSLATSLIQSERWGSSIGRILRVHSESLRRSRRQRAERTAALAPTKMVFPMVVFILPALFLVIGGPMVLGLEGVWSAMGLR